MSDCIGAHIGEDAEVVVTCRECGDVDIDVVVNERGTLCCLVCGSTKVGIIDLPQGGRAA